MSMKCPACAMDISDNAKICPFCRKEIITIKGVGKKTVGVAVYGFFVGGLIGAIGGAIFSNYWYLWAILLGIPCSWLCYTFGLNQKSAR